MWTDDRANGKGRLIHADGDVYVKIVSNFSKESGRMIKLRAKGPITTRMELHTRETGMMINKCVIFLNSKHGFGKETWSDGAQYEG